MDFKKKEAIFRKLQNKIAHNVRVIRYFKYSVISLAVVFISSSFVRLYLSAATKPENFIILVVNSIWILTFVTLLTIYLLKKSKEEENKKLDTQIYHLMKLKI